MNWIWKAYKNKDLALQISFICLKKNRSIKIILSLLFDENVLIIKGSLHGASFYAEGNTFAAVWPFLLHDNSVPAPLELQTFESRV